MVYGRADTISIHDMGTDLWAGRRAAIRCECPHSFQPVQTPRASHAVTPTSCPRAYAHRHVCVCVAAQVWNAAIAALLLGESLDATKIAGGALIVFCAILAADGEASGGEEGKAV